MKLSQVECFLEVVKTGSFTKTAEKLFITQQGISRQIKSLEKYLGFPLFIRSKSGVTLTEEGRFLFREWSIPFNKFQTSIDKARDQYFQKEKILKIALVDMGATTERIVASFAAFEQSEKELSIEFKVMPSSDIRPLINEEKIDFAIVYESEFRDLTSLRHLSLSDHPMNLAAAMGINHPLASKPFEIQEFLSQSFGIISSSGSTHFEEIIQQVYAHYGVIPKAFLEYQFRRELLIAVSTNRCVTIMYDANFQDETDKLKIIPLGLDKFASNIDIFWKNEENSIKAKKLCHAIHEQVKVF